MKNITKEVKYLLDDETKAFAFLATTMPDGSPQVTPVWFNIDGENILINTAKGRVKDMNMRVRPQVAIAIPDPKNPYRYLQVRGRVVDIVDEGADAHIDDLAMTYTGKVFDSPPDQIRVIYKINPEYIDAHS